MNRAVGAPDRGRQARRHCASRVFGRLADLISAVPAQVDLRQTRHTGLVWDEEEIKTILRNGFGSGIPEAKSNSAEIQDELLWIDGGSSMGSVL
jgi:hypothetical protein